MRNTDKRIAYGREGLRLSPATQNWPWRLVKSGGIFQIICEGSGRRYIAASLRPDLRRTVYYFYIKNPLIFNTSNVFFGSKQFLNDLSQYGTDSFYFDMIESHPLYSEDQLVKRKWEIISEMDPKTLYNKKVAEGAYTRSVFYELDDEMRALETRREELLLQIARHVELRDETRDIVKRENDEAIQFRVQRGMKTLQLQEFLRDNTARWKSLNYEIKNLESELGRILVAISIRSRQLAKQYSQVK